MAQHSIKVSPQDDPTPPDTATPIPITYEED